MRRWCNGGFCEVSNEADKYFFVRRIFEVNSSQHFREKHFDVWKRRARKKDTQKIFECIEFREVKLEKMGNKRFLDVKSASHLHFHPLHPPIKRIHEGLVRVGADDLLDAIDRS